MPTPALLLLGEYRRSLDARNRVSMPSELLPLLPDSGAPCYLAKERPGALSLWPGDRWREQLERGVQLVQNKIDAGRLDGRVEDVQRLGRLLSTRQTEVTLAARGRLLIPEGFREFLGVPPRGELMVIGAAVCLELWRPEAWTAYLEEQIAEFRQLFDNLSA